MHLIKCILPFHTTNVVLVILNFNGNIKFAQEMVFKGSGLRESLAPLFKPLQSTQ